jgi:MFS family permease
VTVRALFLCSALSAPYYVLLATGTGGATVSTLGMFVLANGLASSLSAPVWGRLADASSRRVLVGAGTLAAGLGIVMALIVFLAPVVAAQIWIYPLAFFVLGVAHSGVRLGRKTYVVDMAGGDRRTDYVAVSNTVIGFILLLTSLIGLLAGVISAAGVILVLSAMGLAGAVMGSRLPEVE